MSAFIWTVSIINAVVALLALFNAAADDDAKKRSVAASTVVFQGALALWGFWLIFA